MKERLFFISWLLLCVLLLFISLMYRSRTEAMVAQVESQVTAISFQKPVIIERLMILPGQEVQVGDTLLVVSRPDLSLELEIKKAELSRINSELSQGQQNHESQKALLKIETESKINSLMTERMDLQSMISQEKNLSNQISQATGNNLKPDFSDSLKLRKIKSINTEIADLKRYFEMETARLQIGLKERELILSKGKELVMTEINSLNKEKNNLVKLAKFHGTIGTVNVQLDELVPPFKTIVSIYELSPTMIKAFMNERIRYPVAPGDRVRVESENRLYSIEGEVVEIGARITSYPIKIQPQPNMISYGQEIFIRIPDDNQFLNGEMVYVYSLKLEE